jgi:hypothetical protein
MINTETIKIFISYSRKDVTWLTEYLDDLKLKANPLCLLTQWERTFQDDHVIFWYDKRIEGGEAWRKRIFEEIDSAHIAIMLVTPDFVISPVIMNDEVPRILSRHQKSEMEVLPILVQPTRTRALERFNFLNWAQGTPTPLSECYEKSTNEFVKAKNKILDSMESAINRVKKKREKPKPAPLPPPKPLSPTPSPKPPSPTPPSPPPPTDSKQFLFAQNAIYFAVGAKDSNIRSFYYHPGTVVQYSKNGKDGGWPWYQLRGVGDKEIWLTGNDALSNVNTIDNRTFFKIAKTGHMGYLVELWGGRFGYTEEIKIVDNQFGVVKIKSNQIISMTAKQGEMFVQTKDGGVFTGGLEKRSIDPWESLTTGPSPGDTTTSGPCLVTRDAVIALVRTHRIQAFTLNRIAEEERPSLIPEPIYCDRSQLKFRLLDREAIGCFDKSVNDSYIQFVEQSLGWMRISIPQIKKLTVDLVCKEAPVVVETFAGNAYRGVCLEQFDMSGTMISFDKVKNNLFLEAFDRETPSV